MYNIIGPESQNGGGVIGEVARPPRDISADGDVKRLFNNTTILIALRKSWSSWVN